MEPRAAESLQIRGGRHSLADFGIWLFRVANPCGRGAGRATDDGALTMFLCAFVGGGGRDVTRRDERKNEENNKRIWDNCCAGWKRKKQRKKEKKKKRKDGSSRKSSRRPLWICVRLAQPKAGSLRLFIRRLSHWRHSAGSQLPDMTTPLWRIRWQPRGEERPREMPMRLPNTLRNRAELDCRVTVRSGQRI